MPRGSIRRILIERRGRRADGAVGDWWRRIADGDGQSLSRACAEIEGQRCRARV
ncbi:hypothetical protein D3C86_2186240 [compost metagenome]